MAVAEANMPKRKINELEDITNKKSYNKKLKKSYQVQQRLPSPSSCSSSSSSSSPSRHKCAEAGGSARGHSHLKSVSFQPTPQYHSPLLTPKEEDDDDYLLNVQYDIHDDQIPVGAPTPEEPEELGEPDTADLDHNADYIALTSSLRLLTSNKDKIQKEIVELSGLLNYYQNVDDKEQIIEFFIKLLNNDLRLPKQNKILKCPIINWSNYNLTNDCKFNLNNDKPLFKTLNLFNSDSYLYLHFVSVSFLSSSSLSVTKKASLLTGASEFNGCQFFFSSSDFLLGNCGLASSLSCKLILWWKSFSKISGSSSNLLFRRELNDEPPKAPKSLGFCFGGTLGLSSLGSPNFFAIPLTHPFNVDLASSKPWLNVSLICSNSSGLSSMSSLERVLLLSSPLLRPFLLLLSSCSNFFWSRRANASSSSTGTGAAALAPGTKIRGSSIVSSETYKSALNAFSMLPWDAMSTAVTKRSATVGKAALSSFLSAVTGDTGRGGAGGAASSASDAFSSFFSGAGSAGFEGAAGASRATGSGDATVNSSLGIVGAGVRLRTSCWCVVANLAVYIGPLAVEKF